MLCVFSLINYSFTYPPLAEVAMDSLERWQAAFPEQLQHWLPQIIPCLNDYLVDVEKADVSEPGTSLVTEAVGTSAPTISSMSRGQLAQIKRARAKDSQVMPNLNLFKIAHLLQLYLDIACIGWCSTIS